LCLSLLVGLAVFLLAPPPAPPSDSAAPAAPAPSAFAPLASTPAPASTGARESVFISASILSCRAAPSRQGPLVAKLVRGMPVQILARDGDWVSIAFDARQCWALGRFVSPKKPL
jgi:uncharacterized protein YraI